MQYLALDGVYHPFWAAISNNPTLGTDLTLCSAPAHGALTISGPTFQDDFGETASGQTGPIHYNSLVQALEISNLSSSYFARYYEGNIC